MGRGAASVTTFEASYKLDGHDLTLNGNDGRAYQYTVDELDEKTLKLKANSKELGKKAELLITFRRVSQFNPYPTPSASPSAYPQP